MSNEVSHIVHNSRL